MFHTQAYQRDRRIKYFTSSIWVILIGVLLSLASSYFSSKLIGIIALILTILIGYELCKSWRIIKNDYSYFSGLMIQ
jgi:hypothetical protein